MRRRKRETRELAIKECAEVGFCASAAAVIAVLLEAGGWPKSGSSGATGCDD